MEDTLTATRVFGWFFGITVLTIGIVNLILIHPIPGLIYVLLSLVYFPPATTLFETKLGVRIPLVLKIMIAIVIIMFTLGVSDLGDMIDKL